MATLDETIEIVKEFEGAYMGQCAKWDAARWTKVYHGFHDVLSDVPYPLLKLGSRYWRSTEQWFPQPSLLFDALLRLKGMADGLPTPEKAWAEATELVQRRWFEDKQRGKTVYRLMRPGDCSHPLVWETIQDIGVDRLRHGENASHDYAQFKGHYEGLCKRQHTDDVMRLLLPEVRQAMGRLADKTHAEIAAVAETMRV